jgi:hypothetical protein
VAPLNVDSNVPALGPPAGAATTKLPGTYGAGSGGCGVNTSPIVYTVG